jgi:hypothetical protein
MATLRNLVTNKLDQIEWDEKNLEKGRIWAYSPGTEYTNFLSCFCWVAPGAGKVILDVWGAGGSGARMCCCGGGVPGNPGAWARKCICVAAGCFIYGYTGMSCNNTGALCFRGCSEASCVCWFGRNQYTGAAINGCICSEGGRGGLTYCSTGTSLYCCFTSANYCNTRCNDNCGVICNFGSGTANCCSEAYGGDINRRGGVSCTTFMGCLPSCPCSTHYHVAVPPGMFACDGGVVNITLDTDTGYSEWAGQGHHNLISTVNGMSRSPSRGQPWTQCWNSTRSCGNSDTQGCIPYNPPAMGGLPAAPCTNTIDPGWRGGLGLVRITYIEK